MRPLSKPHALAAEKAAALWREMADGEKHGVRFGLFPFDKMQAAEAEGVDFHLLAIALMDCAARDGGCF